MNKKKLKNTLPTNDNKIINGEKATKSKDKISDSKKTQNNNNVTSEKLPASTDTKWYKGVCKWFNASKGWGFLNVVTPSETENKDSPGGDIFVYQAVINKDGFRSLGPGENVEFQVRYHLVTILG